VGGSSGLGREIPLPIAIKHTLIDTVVFDYIPFSKFHTHNGDDTLPRAMPTIRRRVFCAQ
jgi:hypothetical protein